MKYAVRRDRSNYIDVNNYFNVLRQSSTYSGTGTYFNSNTGERQDYDFLLYPKKGTKGQTRILPAGYQLVTITQLKNIMEARYTPKQIKKDGIVVFCNVEQANRLNTACGDTGKYENEKLTNVRFQNGGRMGWMGDDGRYYRSKGATIFINFDSIDFEVPKTSGKVIGYITPTNYFGTNVPAGTLYVKGLDGRANWYAPVKYINDSSPSWDLPAEIVEAWEPVYEFDFKVGDWVYAEYNSDNDCRKEDAIPIFQIAEISKQLEEFFLRPKIGETTGITSKHCRLATPEEIREVTTVTIAGYTAEKKGDKVAFGCNEFTLEQLEAYKYFLIVNNANSMTTQGRKKITVPILNKLIKLYGNI